jgi:hypothetical protein
MTTSGSAPGGDESTERTLTRLVRAMFPHPGFPDGPYVRSAEAILTAAGDDLRFKAQLIQGLVDLDVAAGGSFAGLDDTAAFELLGGFSDAAFFQGVRAQVITTLYDDREVWQLLGYEGPSFDKGGYIERGFADLDWLPEPRIDFQETAV